jgi:hypothetical protein
MKGINLHIDNICYIATKNPIQSLTYIDRQCTFTHGYIIKLLKQIQTTKFSNCNFFDTHTQTLIHMCTYTMQLP